MIVNALGFRTLLIAALLPVLTLAPTPCVFAQEQPSRATPGVIQPGVPGQGAVPTQDIFAAAEKTTTRIVPVEYASTNDLMNVLQLFGVQVIANESPKALVLSGKESAVDLVEDAVEQLDVPPPPVKNVEVIVYLLVAAKGGNIPQGLEPCGPQLVPVMEQLETVFGFQQFGLIDTLLLRGRDGSGVQASGFLPALRPSENAGEEAPADYRIQVDDLQVQTDPNGTARISLNEFTFGTMFSMPSSTRRGPNGEVFSQMSRRDMGISADLDVQEDQMAVVGKANLSMEGDVVFVVVSAHVVPD